MKRVVSLGAGVQSSAMLLMGIDGLFGDVPDFAVFADTQAEPASVYRWLEWLRSQVHPFEIRTVTKGNLAEATLQVKEHGKKKGLFWHKMLLPAFVRDERGRSAPLLRRCTEDYKILVIRAAIRSSLKVRRGESSPVVEQWIGISTDEADRMKPSKVPWIKNRWPLIEKGISREGCIEWMKGKGFPEPPRSACVFCPFHSNREWKRLRDQEPEEFAKAIAFEKRLQEAASRSTASPLISRPFLHRSLLPLDQVDFDVQGELDLWGNECEGVCGV